MSDQAMINITGLWLNKDKNNNQYMAGNSGGIRFWVFKNKSKKKSSDPDYMLKISQNMKPKKEEDKPIQYEDALDDFDDDDTIPF